MDIPENITYSILPVLRRQDITTSGSYESITISNSIKITRFTSCNLLAEKVFMSLTDKLYIYNLRGVSIELFIMGRPWLDVEEFNVKLPELTNNLNEQIEAEVKFPFRLSYLESKAINLINYPYKNTYMDNYGDKIFNKNNNLIGYKLNHNSYATVETYYNENNLLCNKISIKEFDLINLSFRDESFISWVDIRTDFGFIREFNNKKYYYSHDNILINVEKKFKFLSLPASKKNTNSEDKIGTIDLETYGENSGLGFHKVFAGGWCVKGKTNLFYINPNETSEQFVNRLFKSIIYNKNLDGYTFYVHNLGRFDAVFIIKSLISNKNISLIPIWKDNTMLSLTIKQGESKIKIIRLTTTNIWKLK